MGHRWQNRNHPDTRYPENSATHGFGKDSDPLRCCPTKRVNYTKKFNLNYSLFGGVSKSRNNVSVIYSFYFGSLKEKLISPEIIEDSFFPAK